MNPQEAFGELLIAAMKDAALEMKLTQFKTQIDPDGKGIRHVRIIIVPEAMQFVPATGSVFGEEPAPRPWKQGVCPKCGRDMPHYRLKGYQCSHCN